MHLEASFAVRAGRYAQVSDWLADFGAIDAQPVEMRTRELAAVSHLVVPNEGLLDGLRSASQVLLG